MLCDVLVAATLPARDCAVAPFDRGSHHASALSRANGDAAWANADGGVIAPTIPIVAVLAVQPDLLRRGFFLIHALSSSIFGGSFILPPPRRPRALAPLERGFR